MLYELRRITYKQKHTHTCKRLGIKKPQLAHLYVLDISEPHELDRKQVISLPVTCASSKGSEEGLFS